MGEVKLSEPQSQAFFALNPTVGVVAGFGSGKTTTAVVKAFDLLLTYPGIPQGYAAPTYGDIKSIWYPAVEDHCNKHGFKYSIQKSDHVINIHGLGKIVCRSMSNPDKIVGFEVGDFLVDELDILKKDIALNAVRKCKARCRKKYPKKRLRTIDGGKTDKIRKKNQLHIYTTPEGFKATHHITVKEPYKNSRLIQMSTYSNIKNLPPDYIEELMATYPPQLVKAYIMGQFTNLNTGSVYPCFDRYANDAPNAFVLPGEMIYVGMDFNVTNMSAVVHVKRLGYTFAVGEITKIYDTPAMIKAIKNIYPQNGVVVYPDASGGGRNTTDASISDIRLLQAAGFYVKMNPSNPSIKDRVNSMNAMFCNALGERRYYVNVKACPQYTECLEQQGYDKNGLPDKTSGNDHLPDAGGYYISMDYGLNRTRFAAGKVNT